MKPSPSKPASAMICLSMTDEDVVARVARLLGVTYRQEAERDPAWKPAFTLRVGGARAAGLMTDLRSHMGARRQGQIDKALASRQEALKGRKPNLTSEVRAEVVAAYRAGDSARSVAARYGIGREYVHRLARQAEALRGGCSSVG